MKVLNNFKHDGTFYACGEDAPKLASSVMDELKEKGLIGKEPMGEKRSLLKYDSKAEKGAKIAKIVKAKATGKKAAKKATT